MTIMSPISIFQTDYYTAEFMKSMQDFSSLAGVLKDLSTEKMYDSPMEIMRFLNMIQLLNESSLGISRSIDNEEMLYDCYQQTYMQDNEPPSLTQIQRTIHILQRNNWLTKHSHQIKLMDRGKRMMNELIRMMNDSLAYYLQDDISRLLFQAKRDAEISAAYDDKGICSGNKIASMIYHIEKTIQQLEARQLEFFTDCNALSQLEKIHQLLTELDQKITERLQQLQTVQTNTQMIQLMHRSKEMLATGTTLSIGILTKYVRFVSMQQTPTANIISPEKLHHFILSMYEPPIHTNIPTAHDIFSFMEQNQYKDEALDGLWLPVKFATPINNINITEAIHYLETYEPKLDTNITPYEEPIYREYETTGHTIETVCNEASRKMTKSEMDRNKIEHYQKQHSETKIEELIVHASSDEWFDAILSMLSLSSLTI